MEQWFRGKLLTRLEPDSFCIIVQCRWSKDVLPGRLMAGARGKQWRYVRIPALSEGKGDPFGRAEGELLWPGRFNAEALEEIRQDVGSKHFQSQYQGSPVVDGGEVFNAEWFGRYRRDELPRDESGVAKFPRIFCALDSAQKRVLDTIIRWSLRSTKHAGKFYVLDSSPF